jgi:hypothetical protein
MERAASPSGGRAWGALPARRGVTSGEEQAGLGMGQEVLQIPEALPGLAQGLHDAGSPGHLAGEVYPVIGRRRPRRGLQGQPEVGQFPDQEEKGRSQRSAAAGIDLIPGEGGGREES